MAILKINEEALNRIRAAKMTGDSFAKVAQTLMDALAVTGAAETNVTFDYQHDDINTEPGDLIPFITIGLRQATLKFPTPDFRPKTWTPEDGANGL